MMVVPVLNSICVMLIEMKKYNNFKQFMNYILGKEPKSIYKRVKLHKRSKDIQGNNNE